MKRPPMKPGSMRFTRTLRALPREAAHAFARTPLEVLLGAAAWIGLSLAIEHNAIDDAWPHLALTIAIALPLVYATSVLHATATISRATRWLAAAAVITAAALYGFLRFDPDLAAEGWRAAILVATGTLALLATPLLQRARPPLAAPPVPPAPSAPANSPAPAAPLAPTDRRARTHLFAMRLAVRVLVVGLYAAALFGGLAAALGATNGLFALELPGKVYGHLAALVFLLIVPWAVAAGLPDLVAPPAPWSAATLRALRRTGLFLLAPLTTIYLLIVYAYTVRMLVTGELPSNLVSPVVLGAGALTLATTILLEPLHVDDDTAAGLTRFLRLLPALLLPLIALALWAVLIRVGQHGWTEFRYLRVLALLLLGAFAAAGTWRLARAELPPLTALPACAAVVFLLAAVGPLAAPAVAYRSQQARLAALIPPANERSTARPTPLASETLADATNRAAYLRDHFGWNALTSVLPRGATQPDDRSSTALAATLGLTESLDDALPRVIHASLPADAGIPGVQGGTLYLVAYQRFNQPQTTAPALPRPGNAPGRPGAPKHPGTISAPSDTLDPAAAPLRSELDASGTTITIHPATGPVLTADLGRVAEQLITLTGNITGNPVHDYDAETRRTKLSARSIETTLPAATAITPLHDPAGRPTGQLLLRNLTIRATPDSTSIEGWGGAILLYP